MVTSEIGKCCDLGLPWTQRPGRQVFVSEKMVNKVRDLRTFCLKSNDFLMRAAQAESDPVSQAHEKPNYTVFH